MTAAKKKIPLCGKGSFCRPFIGGYPFVYSIIREIQFIAPLTHGHRFTFKSQNFISPSIIGLFLGCSPHNVSRFIIGVIINSVNAVIFSGSRSNMCQKFLKRFIPRLINFNTSGAIPFIRHRCRAITSSFYCLPSVIFRSAAFSVYRRTAKFLYIVHVLSFSNRKIQKAHLGTLDMGFFKL